MVIIIIDTIRYSIYGYILQSPCLKMAAFAVVLTTPEEIYDLLLRIAEAPENRDLKAELRKTASGTKRASIGGGAGGLAGAAAGALIGGPIGAVVGAALGAAAGTSAATYGADFKSIPELLRGASRDDRRKLVAAALEVAPQLCIGLTMGLVVPYVTPDARQLLMEVLKIAGYVKPKAEK